MNNKDVFSFGRNFDRYVVGFDDVLDNWKKLSDVYTKSVSNWPFYNIIKNGENKYTIEIAVSGFGKQNIDIEMKDNTLVVTGGLTPESPDPVDNPIQYIFKGITDKAFTRKFIVSDTVEVKNAELVNGILRIFLENVIPLEKQPKKIEIK